MRQAVASQIQALQPELRQHAREVTQAIASFEDEINNRYDKLRPEGRQTGQAIVVLTAGVPGAGKSTLVYDLENRDSYREIDPDIFKGLCLDVAAREGLLDDWLSRTLADGRPLHRGELSTLVHTYSTDLADALEDRCYERSESFIRQGTFSWPELPSRYLDRLEVIGGYDGYQVLAVEVGRQRALDQAEARWWNARTQGEPDTRYLPPAAINDLYPSPDATYSRSLSTAIDLINRPESADFSLARLTLLDGIDPDQPVTKTYDHTPGHPITVETIERDVAGERRPTTGDLLKQVRALGNQLRTGDVDDRAPTLDHDPTPQRPIDPPEDPITP